MCLLRPLEWGVSLVFDQQPEEHLAPQFEAMCNWAGVSFLSTCEHSSPWQGKLLYTHLAVFADDAKGVPASSLSLKREPDRVLQVEGNLDLLLNLSPTSAKATVEWLRTTPPNGSWARVLDHAEGLPVNIPSLSHHIHVVGRDGTGRPAPFWEFRLSGTATPKRREGDADLHVKRLGLFHSPGFFPPDVDACDIVEQTI